MEFQALSIRALKQQQLKQLSIFSHRGFLFLVVLSCTLFCLDTCGQCFVEGISKAVENDACRLYTDNSDKSLHNPPFEDSELGNQDQTHHSFEAVCTNSQSFCFPSTLPGFSSSTVGKASDSELASNNSRVSDHAIFESFEGGIVSCSSSLGDVVTEESSVSKGPFLDQKTSGFRRSENNDGSVFLPNIAFSPTILDWGQKYLYFPSLASLTVSNTCNDSILHIYEPFSPDPQFYPCNFSEVSLQPGEVASFCFVFLPRYLGSSSAQLILQTSFGGFLVQAKGFVIQSPYEIQPLLGLDLSSGGRNILSLFNPSDETLYIKEVTALIMVSEDDSSQLVEMTCSKKIVHGSDQSRSPSFKGQVGWPMVSMRPIPHWTIGPHSKHTILEIDWSLKPEGKIMGAFFLKVLRSISQDPPDTVMVPLEAEHKGKKVAHDDHESFVSAHLEPIVHHGNVSITIGLKNSAPYMLHLLKITEVAEVETFQVKYIEGLILYPGLVTQVAVITCNNVQSQLHDSPLEMSDMCRDCKLVILTNDSSSSSQIEVDCQSVVRLCPRHWKDSSSIKSGQQSEHVSSENKRTGSWSSHLQILSEIKALDGTEADEMVLQNWKSQGTMSGLHVLDEQEISFPIVEVGSHSSRWITVKNPSQSPVVMQLILNSGEIIDQCQSSNNLVELPSVGLVQKESTMPRRYGFSIAHNAITEAYVHPYSKASFGPILFHPSTRCGWKSSALIRNNLSGVEWLSLSGFGGSLSLLMLEDCNPIQSIEFNFDSSIPLNVSPSESSGWIEQMAYACSQPVVKELYAKNTGDLPLEVKRIEISGTECELDGFFVHNCEGFYLRPGESKRLLISYQTDFSSAVLHRDLELGLENGMLVIPMKVSLPSHMLSICRKPVLWIRAKKLALAALLACLIFIVFCCTFPHAISSLSFWDSFYTSDDKTSTSTANSISRVKTFSLQGKRNTQSIEIRRESGKEKTLIVATAGKYPDSQGLTYQHEKKSPDNWSNVEKEKVEKSSSSLLSESEMTENSQESYLTVKTGKERGRRRRKRKSSQCGAKFTGLFEVSSSQSGNSTPSSPLSPINFGTPGRQWPLSNEESNNPFTKVIEKEPSTSTIKTGTPCRNNLFRSKASVEKCESKLVSSNQEQFLYRSSSSSSKDTVNNRPVLMLSATFPSSARAAPNLMCSSPSPFAPTSSIAPHARAPGSRLGCLKTLDEEKVGRVRDEYIYDIWGDHLSGLHSNLMGKHNNNNKDVPFGISSSTAVEKESDSFFIRGPQTLGANSHLLPSSVTSFHQHG